MTERYIWSCKYHDVNGVTLTVPALAPDSQTTANLIYVDGAEQPALAIFYGSNGSYTAPVTAWRVRQMLNGSGSRFI